MLERWERDVAFVFYGLLSAAVAVYLGRAKDTEGSLSLLASVAACCLPIAECMRVYGAMDVRAVVPMAILLATAFVETYVRNAGVMSDRGVGALSFHALRSSLVGTAVVATAPGGISAEAMGNSVLSAMMIAFMVSLVIAMFFDVYCGRAQFGICAIILIIILHIGWGVVTPAGRIQLDYKPFDLLITAADFIGAAFLLMGASILADEGRFFPRRVSLLFAAVVSGVMGNLLLAIGIVVVHVLYRIPRRLEPKDVVFAIAALAVSVVVSFRLIPMLSDELAFWRDPHSVFAVLPIRLVTLSGGTLGAGIEGGPLSLGPAAIPTEGTYVLGTYFARLGLVGSLGVLVPWVVVTATAFRRLLRGRRSATAAASLVMGLGVIGCTLACLGVIPPLTTGGPFACVGDVQPFGEMLLLFVACELDSLEYGDEPGVEEGTAQQEGASRQ